MLLFVTRHGQPELPHNLAGRECEYPPGDRPLSDLGRRQAALLGERLKKLGFNGRIVSSPYRRTVETAQIVAEAVNGSVELDVSIREIVKSAESISSFRGMGIDEIRAEFPRVEECDLPYPWWAEELESRADLDQRIEDAVNRAEQIGRDCIMVGHGGMLQSVLRILGARSTTVGVSRFLSRHWNCALSRFRLIPSPAAELVASISHIPLSQVTSNTVTYTQERSSGFSHVAE